MANAILKSDERLYMQIFATEQATAPTVAQITAAANRVDDKGVYDFLVTPTSGLRTRRGNDPNNTGATYRQLNGRSDFTVTFSAEYSADTQSLFNHGICAGYFVYFVQRPQGDGTGKPNIHAACIISAPTPGDDDGGDIWTFTAPGSGVISVTDQ